MEEATQNNNNGDRNLLNDTEDDTTKAKVSASKLLVISTQPLTSTTRLS